VALKNNFIFKDFTKEVFADLTKSQNKLLGKASGVVKRQVKTNIKAKGLVKTGNLLKGVKDDKYNGMVLVGMAAPAYHAFIIEYGHMVVLPVGYSPKERGDDEKPALEVVPGNPYFLPAFQSKVSQVINILSEEW